VSEKLPPLQGECGYLIILRLFILVTFQLTRITEDTFEHNSSFTKYYRSNIALACTVGCGPTKPKLVVGLVLNQRTVVMLGLLCFSLLSRSVVHHSYREKVVRFELDIRYFIFFTAEYGDNR